MRQFRRIKSEVQDVRGGWVAAPARQVRRRLAICRKVVAFTRVRDLQQGDAPKRGFDNDAG
jgi:hypothetical protein